jgi:hypothetical protein
MKHFLLNKIRLSYYLVTLFIVFTLLVMVAPDMRFTPGALALFSVNSFLYGFYIAPILSLQKARIEELHKIVRAESNAIFAMVLSIKKLPDELRNELQDKFLDYLKASVRQQKSGEGEAKYEQLITYCLEYKGKYQDQIDKLLDKLVTNQLNRTNFAMQMRNKVYNNEWTIMSILFSVTLLFIILLDAGDGYFYQLLAALLCTGLSMLLLILVKMSTLSHKKARQIWDPYKKLIESHFYRID